jgi:guanine deaminase
MSLLARATTEPSSTVILLAFKAWIKFPIYYDILLTKYCNGSGLNTYTFPREAEFKSKEYALDNYPKVVKRTLQSGTTTACYYATIHSESTLILAKSIQKLGQRAFVGKVNMDRNSPEYYTEKDWQQSLESTIKTIQDLKALKCPLITPVLTPRFVPSCTPELMKALGDLSVKENLPIQSHLSENHSEIEWVSSLHPEASSYSQVYESFGLLNERTIMAHCVHLTRPERQLLLKLKVGISHCPLSNFCLHSGVLNVRQLLEEGYTKVGLGTDVGGGYAPSILEAMRGALTASKVTHIHSRDTPSSESSQAKEIPDSSPSKKKLKTSRHVYEPLNLAETFYLATLGGARVLNLDSKIGNFEKGKDFDALLVDLNGSKEKPIHIFKHDSLMDIFEKFVYLGDDRHLSRIFVNGRQVLKD